MKFHKQIIFLLLFIMPHIWAAASKPAAAATEIIRYRSAESRTRPEGARPIPAAPRDTDSKELIENRIIPNKALMPKLLPSFGNLPQIIKSLITSYNPDNMIRLQLPKPLQLSQANAQRTFNHGALIGALAWHPSRHHVATGGADGKVVVWDCSKKKRFTRKLTEFDCKGTLSNISSIAWHPSGKHILIGGCRCPWEHPITIWNTEARAQVAKIPSNHGTEVAMHASGNLFFLNYFPGPTSICHVTNWTTPSFSYDISYGVGTTYNASWHPSEKLIAGRHFGSGIKPSLVWDIDKRSLSAELIPDIDENVRSIIWHPSGRHIITGSNKGIKVWDTQNGARVAQFLPTMDIHTMACYPRGTHILVATHTWARHPGTFILVAHNKDDKSMLKILDTNTYTVQAELTENMGLNSNYVTDCAYSHDGDLIAAQCNYDQNNIHVWNVALLSQLNMNEDQMALLWALGDAKDKGKESQSLKDIETTHGFDHERLKATIAQFGPEALKYIINYFTITDIRLYVDWRRFLSLKFD